MASSTSEQSENETGEARVQAQPEVTVSAGSSVHPEAEAGYAIGIDVGHYQIRVGVAPREHGEINVFSSQSMVDNRVEDSLAIIADLAGRALADEGVSPDQVVAVGIGFPGPLNQATRTVVTDTFLPGWEGIRIDETVSARLQQRLGRRWPVLVENDANVCLLGEVTHGVARGRRHVFFVKASAGIGAGLLLDGRLYHGAVGAAGEFGHTMADYRRIWDEETDEDGQPKSLPPLCPRCEQWGCLESLASGPALVDQVQKTQEGWREGNVTPASIARNATRDDHPECRKAIQRGGEYLGIALASVVHLLDPEMVIIGGLLSMAGEVYLKEIRTQLLLRRARMGGAEVEVILAGHRDSAGVYGAIDLVFPETVLAAVGPPSPGPSTL